jgi:XTP/dITP diphosphohydrolase
VDRRHPGEVTDADGPSDPLRELVAVMDRLRSPGGCAWDAAQTHASLVPYLLEEAHELAEAVDAGDRAGLREELGDVLLQVVFHARLAQEDPDDPFDVDDVARDLVAKLVHRHPHVFAGADTPDERLHAQWDAIKKAEKGRQSALDGIPGSLPALARAQKVAARADRAGLDVRDAAGGLWPIPASSALPVGSEPVAVGTGQPSDASGAAPSLGERLLGLALQAHDDGVDAEGELRRATAALERALRARERDRDGRPA